MKQELRIGDCILGKEKLVLISGPCVIESRDHTMFAAEQLQKIAKRSGCELIFKSSFDKANRSSIHSYRGPGIDLGLKILEEVKTTFGLPVLSDIHLPSQAKAAGDVLDIIQIPAFLCRQTDLLIAAAETKKIVNVKKGQFMAPWDMKNSLEKVIASGNDNVFVTERGSSFGYNNLVSDMRSIAELQKLHTLVCFDASHSVQLPGGLGTTTGGNREYVPLLAKSALAAGADLLFIESHDQPHLGKSDASSMISFNELEKLLPLLKRLYELIHQHV